MPLDFGLCALQLEQDGRYTAALLGILLPQLGQQVLQLQQLLDQPRVLNPEVVGEGFVVFELRGEGGRIGLQGLDL
jgi:hypothetical protein